MQLQDLNAFVAVASDRSFSKAAKKLHRTQPAVSQAIRRLEDELGDKLFDRTSRNGALTEAGVLLQEHATRLLRFASEAEAAVRAANVKFRRRFGSVERQAADRGSEIVLTARAEHIVERDRERLRRTGVPMAHWSVRIGAMTGVAHGCDGLCASAVSQIPAPAGA